MSYVGRSIKEVHSAFRSGALTPSKLLEDSQARLSATQHLNAFVNVLDEPRNVGWTEGPLGGIPLAVKDNFCVQGTATTCASEMLMGFRPPYTATVVQKALSGGAVLLGKTNMDEFAMGSGSVDSIFGPVFNPWLSDEDLYIAGGSSGGSAAAVASGASMIALGSDTGGSVRIPAAWCGISSLKPTYGALSRHGLIPLVNSLDVPGLMANYVEDLEVFFRVLKGRDECDSTSVESGPPLPFNLKSLKIGIPEEYHCEGMSEDVLSAWSDVVDLLQDEGLPNSPVSLPHTPYSLMCYSVLNAAEIASNMARYDGMEYGLRIKEVNDSLEELYASNRTHGFNDVVKSRILIGNTFLLEENYENFFIQALKVRHLIYRDFEDVFSQGIDLLVTPVTLSDAPLYKDFIGEDNRKRSMQHDYCTQPVNLAGLPAATLPVKLSEKGLPLAVQIIGRAFEDEKVLALAKHIESIVGFPRLCSSI